MKGAQPFGELTKDFQSCEKIVFFGITSPVFRWTKTEEGR